MLTDLVANAALSFLLHVIRGHVPMSRISERGGLRADAQGPGPPLPGGRPQQDQVSSSGAGSRWQLFSSRSPGKPGQWLPPD